MKAARRPAGMLSRLFGRKAPRLEQLAHRRILKQDVERMRWTGDGGFVMPKDNPGIRVEPNFVSAAEAKALVKEAEAAAQGKADAKAKAKAEKAKKKAAKKAR